MCSRLERRRPEPLEPLEVDVAATRIALFGIALIAGLSGASLAQQVNGTSEGSVRVYLDDDHVQVISPSVSAQVPVGESLSISIASTVDAVSAASVDVISQASPTRVRELRVEGSTKAAYEISRTMRVRAGGVVSHETDYDSFRPTVGGQVELADRNATVDFGYSASFDWIGSAVDRKLSNKRRGHILRLGLTQIVDTKTYFDLLGEGRSFRGYHANPYRMVQIGDGLSPALSHVKESTPALRRSAAIRLQVRRALGTAAAWFAHVSYRLYVDDWQIRSHTLAARLLHSFWDGRYLAELQGRLYFQGAADFYQPRYDLEDGAAPEFRTKDRSLSSMQSFFTGITADAPLSDATESWRLRASLTLTQFLFDNVPAQGSRRAMTLSLALKAPL